jgi:hypothetical protein
LNEETGYPKGWKVDEHGVPLNYINADKYKIPIPDYDDRVFHKRILADDKGKTGAPWRRISERLTAQAIARSAKRRAGVPIEDIKWEDEEEDEDMDATEGLLFGPDSEEIIAESNRQAAHPKKRKGYEDEDLFGPHGDDVVQQAEVKDERKKKKKIKPAPVVDLSDDSDIW